MRAGAGPGAACHVPLGPRRFGGGPAVSHLYVCSSCRVEIEALAKRRRVEIDTFIKVRRRARSWGVQ